ncbi:hypothetical protein THRCLA_00617 [Thraustotheca clavata]|uniref:PDZ domain-containing protein n=1 Tax=Thraustotheca clavata TaxID=74557 RepID=A0A1W0AAM4_9STRA|nr:hypothetical protein THRCLA_00617 [Thraustotheca clavata]
MRQPETNIRTKGESKRGLSERRAESLSNARRTNSTSSSGAEYELIWHRDNLAVALRCNSKQQTVIKRVQEQTNQVETTAGLASANVGDVLVAINWEDCTQFTWDQVKDRLSQRDLPLTLTFKTKPPGTNPTTERPRRQSKAVAIPPALSLPPLLANEYNVTWSQGKLGVVIHMEEGNRAMVKERTAISTDPSTGQIEPRDELIYVNDAAVSSIGYEEALKLMRGKKPIYLRFRRAMASGTLIDSTLEVEGPTISEPYQLVWTTGPLGIVLKKNRHDEIFVQQLTGKGLSEKSGRIQLGDILVSVTGVPTQPLGLAGTVDFLQCIQKPAVLEFEHRVARPDSQSSKPAAPQQPKLPAPVRKLAPKDSFEDQSIAMMSLPDLERPTGTTVVLAGALGDTFLQGKKEPESAPPKYITTPSNVSEEIHDFEVEWRSGKLGVVIHLEDDVHAVVREITGTATDPNLAMIQARDELISVNGVLVQDVGYATSLQSMKGPKPIRLRFRRGLPDDGELAMLVPEDSATVNSEDVVHDDPIVKSVENLTEPKVYSLLWQSGPLGIVLKINDINDIYVAQLTGKGLSAENDCMQIGDVLVSVTGVPTKPLGLAGTVDFLKCIQKPSVLVFEQRVKVPVAASPVHSESIEVKRTPKQPVQTPVVQEPVAAPEEPEIETRQVASKSIEVLRRPIVHEVSIKEPLKVTTELEELIVPTTIPAPIVPQSPLLAPRVSIQPRAPHELVLIESPLNSPSMGSSYAPLSVIMTPQSMISSLSKTPPAMTLSPPMSPEASPKSPKDAPSSPFTPVSIAPVSVTPFAPSNTSEDSQYVSPESPKSVCINVSVDSPLAKYKPAPHSLDEQFTREIAQSFMDRASDMSAMPERISEANPAIDDNNNGSTLYSIIWTGGALGIAIKYNRLDEVCVMALTGGGLAGESDIINVGDVLVAVGNITVRNSTLEDTKLILKEARTPVSLVFLRAPNDRQTQLSMGDPAFDTHRTLRSVEASTSNQPSESKGGGAIFSVVWEGGPLGIVVRKNANDENFVKDLTGDGLSAKSDLIQRGDVLISVADVRVRNLSLAAASQVMQSVRKPTFLVFRRQPHEG